MLSTGNPWVYKRAPESWDEFRVPSFLYYSGLRRLDEMTAIIGEDKARRLASQMDYILSDELVKKLQLKALSIPNGRVSHLSPKQWLSAWNKRFPVSLERLKEEWEKKGWELKGILVKENLPALHLLQKELDVWETAIVIEHLLFQDHLNLLVDTRGRV